MKRSLDKLRSGRWFRFSLRTLFCAVTLLCLWLAVQVKWIRDRHEALSWLTQHHGIYSPQKSLGTMLGTGIKSNAALLGIVRPRSGGPDSVAQSPWSIRILGEQGVGWIDIPSMPDTTQTKNLERLFPEAQVSDVH